MSHDASLDRVIARLKQRRAAGYRAGGGGDGEHVALVVEGGGMRGVAAGGMVSALEDMGLTECFDSIHGSSAGAAAGAYFLCGRANLGTRMFYEDLIDRRFIDLRRMARLDPAMDTDFLVDEVMDRVKPIDFPRIAETAPRLHISLTDIDSGAVHVVSRFEDYAHYRECLKASVTMPVIAGGPRLIDGRRVMDGGLVQQIALDSAFAAGATMVLALMTRREDEKYRPLRSIELTMQSWVLQARYGGRLGAIYRQRNATINRAVACVDSGLGPAGQLVGGIRLHHSIDYVHRLTQDPAMLRLAAEVSRDHVADVFERHIL